MGDSPRKTARKIARMHLEAGDPLGWFEDLYARAGEDTAIIPWADLTPNPNLIDYCVSYKVVEIEDEVCLVSSVPPACYVDAEVRKRLPDSCQ